MRTIASVLLLGALGSAGGTAAGDCEVSAFQEVYVANLSPDPAIGKTP